ncbi:hypothetical protein [Actinoplanes sp. RD1]|uniref:hypothetical protein n=1 Tax=Actinoplanes sp. RD1 TaxID=3064538 RepID=UPI0027408906|nr:hypothetical protein [Actinoplanes sp. RD1]
MDVRGVLRRVRVPLVASLFFALAGGPVAAPAVHAPALVVSQAAHAPVSVVSQAAASSVVAVPASPAPALVVAEDEPATVFRSPVLPLWANPQLSGLVGGSAAAPRAPPARA